jgi:hypothetical protein
MCRPTFETLWNRLLVDYPEATNYLMHHIDPRKTTWAKAFTGRVFTAGITSTQRSEGINGIIKEAVNNHTSLNELFKVICDRVCHESFHVQYTTR